MPATNPTSPTSSLSLDWLAVLLALIAALLVRFDVLKGIPW
jgi:hypothetical protein